MLPRCKNVHAVLCMNTEKIRLDLLREQMFQRNITDTPHGIFNSNANSFSSKNVKIQESFERLKT